MLNDCTRKIGLSLLQIRAILRSEMSLPQSALIISPHPDDEVFGCGGLIHRMIGMNRKVHIVLLTGGEKSLTEVDDETLRCVRRRLMVQAVEKLGLDKKCIYFLNYPDGGVHIDCMETYKLQEIVMECQASAIFIPHCGEGWPDHVKVHSILQTLDHGCAELYEYCVWMYYWHYNIWHLDWKNACILSMSDVEYEAKQKAMRIYLETQAPCGKPYSGVLPSVLIEAHRWRKELYFKATK